MNSNTSSYKQYTFQELLKQYDKILIPMIQRDYAQGRTDKKATDVRNNLLNDIFSNQDVRFNLVFGSKEKRIIDNKETNCFIPIDGQQRLTTLFLLYLYGQKTKKTDTKLDLSKFSYDTRRAASDFCKSVTGEEWCVQNDNKVKVSDVIKDSSWFMNYWAQDPTVEGMLNMLDAIHEKCKEDKSYPNLSKVTFYFFDLESNGLNENLYLKMNSRGKPLTAFENLKAKMEKVLPNSTTIEERCFPICDSAPKGSFKEKWKYFMDRNWMETFWDKEHPEKYDESIAKFIVRFLSGYWAAFGEDKEQAVTDELKSLNSKNDYTDFIPFEPIKKVLDSGNAFPLLAHALTTITDNLKIKPYWSDAGENIQVSEKTEYKIISVVFTQVLFDGDNAAMRFAWNMAENFVTGYDNFVIYCKQAKEIHNKYKLYEDKAFYKTLSNNNFINSSDQLAEEITKAKQILDENEELREYKGTCKKQDGSDYQTWEEIIIDAESYAFFKGATRFLFTDGKGQINWNDFDTKWTNAKKYFDENGVREDFKIELAKKLVIQCNDWELQLYDKQIFNPNSSTWKWILTAKNWITPIHNILLNSIIIATTNNDEKVKKFVTPVLEDLPFDYFIENMPDGRFHRYGPRLCFYKPNGRDKATLDWDNWKRNKLLSSLMKQGKITTDAQMSKSNFFWGMNVNFSYEGKCFQWYGNPNEKELDVYLMEGNDYKKRSNQTSDKGTDEDKYYCFRVDDKTDTNAFIESLNKLIKEAGG